MNSTIALDSNLLTYLLRAMSPSYNPETDKGKYVPELIAIFRCYIYVAQTFYITPTVVEEYLKISDSKEENGVKFKDLHQRLHKLMLMDLSPAPCPKKVDCRKDYYLKYHKTVNDCKILAEAEIGRMDILLTNDDEFYNRLHRHTKSLKLMKPTEFWESLKIAKGSRPILEPRHENPLYGKNWWRWQ